MDNTSSPINHLKLGNVCRTCLSKESLIPLFSKEEDEETDVQFTAAIHAVTQLEIKKDDGLPKVICETCQLIVKQAYLFITKSHEADSLLREHLGLAENTDPDNELLKEDYSHWEDVSELATLEVDICTAFEPLEDDEMEARDKKAIKTCPICDNQYKTQKSLDAHMAKEHVVKRKRGRPRKDGNVFVPIKESQSKKIKMKIKSPKEINENNSKSLREMIIENDDIKIENEIDIEYEPELESPPKKKVKTCKCPFCNDIFDSNREVVKHYEADHDETIVYRCNNCECNYLEYETFKKHEPCEKLKKDTTNYLEIDTDMPYSTVLLHTVLRPGDYKSKITILECGDCGCLLLSRADLKQHINERHYERSLRCHLCSKEFPTHRDKKRHMAKCDGTPETVFECPDCNQEFSAELALNKHILSLHAGANASVTFINKSRGKPDQIYPCEECSETFSTPELLAGHINYEHKTTYECHICQRKFTRIYNLWSHSRVHDPSAELKLQKRAKPKKCLCNFCGQGFSNTSNLIVHVRRHTGEKPYKCDFCDKAYPRSYDLAIHRRTHTGEKPCPCPICGKSFSRSNKLTRHMHIHTGQKPYKCDYCDKAFTQSNDLRTHVRRHTGDKPYCCELCGERFINGSALQTHRRAQGHHPPSSSVHPPSGYMPIKHDSPEPPNTRVSTRHTFAL